MRAAADNLVSTIDLWPLLWLDINNVLLIYTVLSCVKNAEAKGCFAVILTWLRGDPLKKKMTLE